MECESEMRCARMSLEDYESVSDLSKKFDFGNGEISEAAIERRIKFQKHTKPILLEIPTAYHFVAAFESIIAHGYMSLRVPDLTAWMRLMVLAEGAAVTPSYISYTHVCHDGVKITEDFIHLLKSTNIEPGCSKRRH
jgi:hypothetical protein